MRFKLMCIDDRSAYDNANTIDKCESVQKSQNETTVDQKDEETRM